MAKKVKIPGFFWKNILTEEYCVIALDPSRRERNPRDRRCWRTWIREWYATTMTELRRLARKDGIILPRDTRALCDQSPREGY